MKPLTSIVMAASLIGCAHFLGLFDGPKSATNQGVEVKWTDRAMEVLNISDIALEVHKATEFWQGHVEDWTCPLRALPKMKIEFRDKPDGIRYGPMNKIAYGLSFPNGNVQINTYTRDKSEDKDKKRSFMLSLIRHETSHWILRKCMTGVPATDSSHHSLFGQFGLGA